MSGHAELSPSAASRWLSCPGSIKLTREHGLSSSNPTAAALEGTHAHELFEHILKGAPDAAFWSWRGRAQQAGYDAKGMERQVGEMASHVQGIVATNPGALLFVEERVQTGIPGMWGTADAIVVVPETAEAPGKIYICDLKWGMVEVSPEENAQLRSYAMGALRTFCEPFGDEIDEVQLVILQPRTGTGQPKVWKTSAAEILRWRDIVLPLAAEALAGSDKLNPSEDNCRFCPARGVCAAREKFLLDQAQLDFDDLAPVQAPPAPSSMTPDRIAAVIKTAPQLRAWLDEVEKFALVQAQAGTSFPGMKLVRTPGRRFINDHVGLVQVLIDRGFRPEDVSTVKAKGIGALTSLLGKDLFEIFADSFVEKSPGQIKLVPESAKGDALTPGTATRAVDVGDFE